MVAVDILGGEPKTLAIVSRRLLELRPGLFVGCLSKRTIEAIWSEIIESSPSAALIVYPAKNELGIGIKTIGDHQYGIVDHFGIPLVTYKKIGAKLSDT